MKKIILLLFITFSTSIFAQKNYFVKKGAVARGYDVVAYFNNEAKQGSKEISTEYDGVNFYFSSEENRKKFKQNPMQYLPQYGGFCAYAMGVKGSKVSINPETFEIREGKLYLFYNRGNTNTLDLWTKEGADELKTKADKNWKKITKKK
ncbi:YHS domain-containing (seleno)protein [Pseudotenacibaculum sp. MALMAid0570]|uniref:YHS domain-containing (seleno)protein n=1 Tax=Pseudotenacibaculum sp. MALMAid0570 TaxID=3143938 RepID=UPI0032DFAF03